MRGNSPQKSLPLMISAQSSWAIYRATQLLMNINSLKERKFLTKEDCGKGILVTIDVVTQENVAREGAPEELKHCLNFKEELRPMVLNMTNARLIAGIIGSEETDKWAGCKIVLYCDPTVSYSGKIV